MMQQYGRRPNHAPTRRGGAGAPSQVFCAAKSWRRGNSLAPGMSDPLGVERPQGAEPQNKTIRQRQMVLFLVRAWGLEPQRRKAREPKSRMSTNSITGANRKRRYWPPLISLYFDTGRFPRRSKTLYPRTVTNGTIILPQPRRLDKWANANAAQNFLVHAN